MSGHKEDSQKNLTDLTAAVAAARAELFTVIHSLTDMLQAIAVRVITSKLLSRKHCTLQLWRIGLTWALLVQCCHLFVAVIR